MSGDSGFTFNPESPYRKEITEEISRDDELEICSPKKNVHKKKYGIGLDGVKIKKTVSFVHKKPEEADCFWEILLIKPDGSREGYKI